MSSRITVVYTCNHEGKKLSPIEQKFWDICPPPGAVCFCLPDGEKQGHQKPTPMSFKITVVEQKPE